MNSKKKNNSSANNKNVSGKAPEVILPPPREALKGPFNKDFRLLGLFVLYACVLGGIACARFATLPNAREAAAHITQLRITAFDQIANPGEKVPLLAKFEHDGVGPINPDYTGKPVSLGFEMAEGKHSLFAARTDNDGMAEVGALTPIEIGSYRMFAHPLHFEGRPGENSAFGTLFVVNPNKEIIVCDIDDTLTEGSIVKAIQGKGKALPNSVATLVALSVRFQIVYLTARDDSLINRTRNWLIENGYPRGPVFARDWSMTNLNKGSESKQETLKTLKAQIKNNLAWGIGNNAGDATAYLNNSLKAVILHKESKPLAEGAVMKKNWKEIEAYFAEQGVFGKKG